MRIEQAGDAVLEEHRLVDEPDEVIVDVAEAVGQRLRDHRELTAGQTRNRVALRQDDTAE